MGDYWNRTNNRSSEAVLACGRLGELLGELGCDATACRGENHFRGPCPVHLGDGDNFEVRADGDRLPIYWACHSRNCHRHRNLRPSLLGLVRGALTGDPDRPASLERAKDFLDDFLARGDRPAATPPRTGRRARSTRTTLSLTREQVRGRLVIPSPYFLGRGYSPEVLDRVDVGDSPRLSRAVVPVYDDLGEACVGFASRSFRPYCGSCWECHDVGACRRGEARWLFNKGFAKSEYLFNYAAVSRSQAPFVLLVEGPPDVLRAADAGFAAVCGFGNDISMEQMRKLKALGRRVVVAFDNDAAGVELSRCVAGRLDRGAVRAEARQPPKGFKDLGEMPTQEAAEWLRTLSC